MNPKIARHKNRDKDADFGPLLIVDESELFYWVLTTNLNNGHWGRTIRFYKSDVFDPEPLTPRMEKWEATVLCSYLFWEAYTLYIRLVESLPKNRAHTKWENNTAIQLARYRDNLAPRCIDYPNSFNSQALANRRAALSARRLVQSTAPSRGAVRRAKKRRKFRATKEARMRVNYRNDDESAPFGLKSGQNKVNKTQYSTEWVDQVIGSKPKKKVIKSVKVPNGPRGTLPAELQGAYTEKPALFPLKYPGFLNNVQEFLAFSDYRNRFGNSFIGWYVNKEGYYNQLGPRARAKALYNLWLGVQGSHYRSLDYVDGYLPRVGMYRMVLPPGWPHKKMTGTEAEFSAVRGRRAHGMKYLEWLSKKGYHSCKIHKYFVSARKACIRNNYSEWETGGEQASIA